MKLQYSVIRFVPNPVMGEFVNLGVIVGSDETSQWAMETVSKHNRAFKLDPEKSTLPTVIGELTRLEAEIEKANGFDEDDRESEISEAWLRAVADETRSTLQFSSPLPILADSPSEALDTLWPRFVFEPEPVSNQAVTRRNIRAKLRSALQHRLLGASHFKERATLNAGQSTSTIDFAIHNGRVKQITQCWSFQIESKDHVLNDVKAWAWTARLLRQEGGFVEIAQGRPIEVPSEVPLIAVCVKPRQDSSQEQFEEATATIEHQDIGGTLKDFENIEAIADEAVATLGN